MFQFFEGSGLWLVDFLSWRLSLNEEGRQARRRHPFHHVDHRLTGVTCNLLILLAALTAPPPSPGEVPEVAEESSFGPRHVSKRYGGGFSRPGGGRVLMGIR